ncbi:MAG: hypothetical protein LBJ23_02255 [Tannerella sp.]|jgi:hypothetical protein|nr:hypothetical protein [Tannerella sp.]
MEKTIARFMDYSIQESDAEHLYELAEFVVSENYEHHAGSCDVAAMHVEIMKIYQEELRYMPNSRIFVARDLDDRIIGTIRITRWDYEMKLPMQKLFGEHTLKKVLSRNKAHPAVWHIGRFAVAQSGNRYCHSLFKQLIVCAIIPVMMHPDSIIIAECDSKLNRVLSALGIRINNLGRSIHYLGSETIPVCITKQGIEQFFYREYAFLMQKTFGDVKRTLSDACKFSGMNLSV